MAMNATSNMPKTRDSFPGLSGLMRDRRMRVGATLGGRYLTVAMSIAVLGNSAMAILPSGTPGPKPGPPAGNPPSATSSTINASVEPQPAGPVAAVPQIYIREYRVLGAHVLSPVEVQEAVYPFLGPG